MAPRAQTLSQKGAKVIKMCPKLSEILGKRLAIKNTKTMQALIALWPGGLREALTINYSHQKQITPKTCVSAWPAEGPNGAQPS